MNFDFAALADALHRIEQTLGRVEPRAIGTATQAGADLRLLLGILAECAALLIAAVVGRQPHDDVALLVRDQHVARAAIVRAARHHRGQFVILADRARRRRPSQVLSTGSQSHACDGSTRRRSLEKIAAVHVQCRLPRSRVPSARILGMDHRACSPSWCHAR